MICTSSNFCHPEGSPSVGISALIGTIQEQVNRSSFIMTSDENKGLSVSKSVGHSCFSRCVWIIPYFCVLPLERRQEVDELVNYLRRSPPRMG